MMLVNNPGDWSAVYGPLLHASWHGWTFTDLIFPFFLWIVGVALALSTARRVEQGQDRHALLVHALRRSLILFGLGLFLSSFGYFIDGSLFRLGPGAWLSHYLTSVRIPGVLQRIAVCYLISSVLVIYRPWRVQAVVLAGLLATYWILMMCVPVPGYGAGVLEKGGNLSAFVDNAVLNGPVIGSHVWRSTKTWDPEGILSTMPAIATCLFGVLAGHLLRSGLSLERKTVWLFASGNALLLCGSVLDQWMPINKNLWTPSYSVFMAGMASVGFAFCYWLIDALGWKGWSKPLEIYGLNAITVFVLSGLFGRLLLEWKVRVGPETAVTLKTWLYQALLAPLASPKVASLLWALVWVVLLYGIACGMYRKRWFVKF